MLNNLYHGILVDQSFQDKLFPEQFKQFNRKKDGNWIIVGIEVDKTTLEKTIEEIQEAMLSSGTWYNHLYSDNELIVMFKDKIFRVTPDISTWNEIVKYGANLGIAKEQLDFWPNRFQDENHYF